MAVLTVPRLAQAIPARTGLALAFALFVSRATTAWAEPEQDASAPRDATPNGESAASGAATATDEWPDLSDFLDQKLGFLPLVVPITEPAVGYGVAGGLAFISKPFGEARAGHGRPNITFVGGMGTENGSWGLMAGDMRHWLDDRLQTVAGIVDASVNLDFHGLGKSALLDAQPLRYTLAPKAVGLRAKYRIGDSAFWAGLGYAFAATQVSFEAPAGTPGLPDYDGSSNVGGLTLVASFDTRDNFFTPLRGTFLEASFGFFGEALGGDDAFERSSLVAMQFVPLPFDLYLGLRGDAAIALGDAPFYLWPFINLRGVSMMRYQGKQLAQAEAELRWQFWRRFSLLGFVGGGGAWNDFERFDNWHGVLSGGTGFRYELAHRYGLHMGIDVAFSRDTTAAYLQVGNAWMRP